MTQISLLQRIQDPADTMSWQIFARIYEPFIEGYLRRRGVSGELALDVRQEVLLVVSRRIGSFQHNGRVGAFRNWLRATTVNCLRSFLRQQKQESPGGTDIAELIEQLSDENSELSFIWNREHNDYVLRQLLARLESNFQESSLAAFRRTYLDGVSADEVAEELQMSKNAVIVARCKVLSALRQQALEILD